jgi:pectate lyase
MDVVAAFNAANATDLSPVVGWTPTLFTEIHPTQAVPGLVSGNAGVFKDE